MKAVRFYTTGGPEVLVHEDLPDPSLCEDEILIKVDAVGMNFADVMRRRGEYYPTPTPLPFILGAEVAGTIAAVGAQVTNWQVGMRVMAIPREGGYAQYVCVPASTAILLPPGVDSETAVALVVQGLTAAISLRQAARLSGGDSVLVTAAAGGVGSIAIQLAKLFGAGKVIAAAGTPQKRALARSLGADATIDYGLPDWSGRVRELTKGRGVDVALDLIGGDTTVHCIKTLAPYGRLVVIGRAGGKSAQIDPWPLTELNLSVIGFFVTAYLTDPFLIRAAVSELMGYLVSGQLKMRPGAVLPLTQVAEAHRLLESRQTTGKVVLQPWK